MIAGTDDAVLRISGLEVAFGAGERRTHAVTGVDLEVFPGETVAIVGGSGSGKSTTAHAVIGLLPAGGAVSAGRILFGGEDITRASGKRLESLRGREIGFVPQDSASNLNPVWSIGYQVGEAIRANGVARGRRAVRDRTVEVLAEAGLSDPEERIRQYPHQFSGGMRQRALIGMGLAARPRLLIADEPTSALDVTVQRAILDHLAALTSERGTSVLFITHDLRLAAERADRVIVMHRGGVVESGPAREVLANPQHPYTRRLVEAAPRLTSPRIQVSERSRQRETGTMIDIVGVSKVYPLRRGGLRSELFTAVDGVTFSVPAGTTTALVGESGSGKSTLAKMVLGLEKPSSGRIVVGGAEIGRLDRRQLLELRRRMQPVFQDPYGSLDPLRSIQSTIAEPLAVHGVGSAAERRRRVRELLDQVALPASFAGRYPSELSGGQRQRVAIARALALHPEVVLLDEAVSALDVLVQSQVLELLARLQAELGLTYLFITHDLAVVRTIADRVCVMRRGRLVEQGTTEEVFASPQQEYTRALLDAVPGEGIPLGRPAHDRMDRSPVS